MIILSFGNEKGGVGKTTSAYLFAAVCTMKIPNLQILYVDADRQNSSQSLRKLDLDFYQVLNNGRLFNIKKTAPVDIFPVVEQAEKDGVDIVILDLPANTDASGVMAAYSLCDYIFVPTGASELDTDSSQQFIEELTEKIAPIRQEAGKETSIYLLFANVNRRLKKYKELYNSVRQSFPVVCNSVPSRASDFQNRGIFETLTKSPNKHEYFNFGREILKIIGYGQK